MDDEKYDDVVARLIAAEEREAQWALSWSQGIYPSPDIANAEELRRAYARGWIDRRRRGSDLAPASSVEWIYSGDDARAMGRWALAEAKRLSESLDAAFEKTEPGCYARNGLGHPCLLPRGHAEGDDDMTRHSFGAL
jgi:hypothetical protein